MAHQKPTDTYFQYTGIFADFIFSIAMWLKNQVNHGCENLDNNEQDETLKKDILKVRINQDTLDSQAQVNMGLWKP